MCMYSLMLTEYMSCILTGFIVCIYILLKYKGSWPAFLFFLPNCAAVLKSHYKSVVCAFLDPSCKHVPK